MTKVIAQQPESIFAINQAMVRVLGIAFRRRSALVTHVHAGSRSARKVSTGYMLNEEEYRRATVERWQRRLV